MTITQFKGYKQVNFEVDGRKSFVVCPEVVAHGRPCDHGKPWVWRAEFFGAFDTVDMALLQRGWHLAYHNASDMYGCPKSVEYFKQFYDTVVPAFGLSEKTVLFGFSRGGMYSVNYALAYPETVFALYLDAPVLDMKSWPGGKGEGSGTESCWEECKKWYGLDEDTAMSYKDNPVDNAEKLAALDIPVIIVAGGSDRVVPAKENCIPFAERFLNAGGTIKMIIKPDCDHHPHSLQDPAPVVDFIERMF